ncbi:hypothetical protein [Asticcacaulis sp.]|uniref:hypothetical protein n=1 Tax=Asticcacaulis sp. TaxID=1872648 RepID=UPI003F7B94B7
MTQKLKSTPIITPWDMATVYAASFGLFAPGTLMAARRQAMQMTSQPPQQG